MAAIRYNYSYTNPMTFTRGGLTIGVPSRGRPPPGLTDVDGKELRELTKRNRLLEQENEVLPRSGRLSLPANLPGKWAPDRP